MKLLIIHSHLFKTGGDWTYLNNLSELFKSNGWIVSKFGVVPDNESYGEDLSSIDKGIKSNIYINHKINIFNFLQLIRVTFNLKIFIKLFFHVLKFKPDVVQLNSIHTTLSPSVLVLLILLKPFLGFKIFWRLLDYKLICPNRTLRSPKSNDCRLCINKIFPYNVLVNRCKRGSFFGSFLFFIENSLFNIMIRIFNPISGYLSQSKFTANLISKSYLNANSKSFILSNPYVPKISRPAVAVNKFVYDLIYFGRLSDEKGIRELLLYICESNIKIAIVGDGPLKNLVSDYSAKYKNISFHGSLWGDELYPILCASKFSIVPSLWNEVSPYSIIESLASGIPVLGTRVGGIVDMIIPDFNGDFISLSSPNEFLRSVERAISLRDNFNSSDISAHALDEYSIQTYFNKSSEIFTNA